MNGHVHDRVDEHRAAVLLGLPESDLRRYSRASGLGHVENDDKGQRADRKSTRLNSSHGYISYAVFCLKKKILRHTSLRSALLISLPHTPRHYPTRHYDS